MEPGIIDGIITISVIVFMVPITSSFLFGSKHLSLSEILEPPMPPAPIPDLAHQLKPNDAIKAKCKKTKTTKTK